MDLCLRGITHKFLNDSTLNLDIPYCALTNTAAYNVQLKMIVLEKTPTGYRVVMSQTSNLANDLVITKELGKSINGTLEPVKANQLHQLRIYIKGSYTNIDRTKSFRVSDVFKPSTDGEKWMRALSDDKEIRIFLASKKLL